MNDPEPHAGHPPSSQVTPENRRLPDVTPFTPPTGDGPGDGPGNGPNGPSGGGGGGAGHRGPGRPSLILTLVAWAVIVAVTLFVIVIRDFGAATPETDAAANSVEELLMNLQGRTMLGMVAGLPEDAPDRALAIAELESQLNLGSPRQRLRFAVLAAEAGGPDEGLRILGTLDEAFAKQLEQDPDYELTEEDDAMRQSLQAVWEGDRITDDEAGLLETELGWWGTFFVTGSSATPRYDADAHEAMLDGPRERMNLLIIGFTLLIGGLVIGFVGLLIMIVLFVMGTARSRMQPGMMPHSMYVETFAVWMVLFMVFTTIAALLVPDEALVATAVGFFLSLLALLYPRLRGSGSLAVTARDVGLTGGTHPVLELLIGAGGYLMAFPIAAVGILLTLALMAIMNLFGGGGGLPLDPAGGPAHPIVGELADGDVGVYLRLLLIGAVAAPIVEEAAFRGLLYRHLRDAWRPAGWIFSVGGATIVNAFVFAVIHPQGWVGVPALMSLAVAFTLVREWRDSLIAPMVMHALFNGLNFTALFLFLST